MAGLVLFELVVLSVFAILLLREQRMQIVQRADRRLEYQARLFSLESADALQDHEFAMLRQILHAMRQAPSVRAAQLTDMQGRTLYSTEPSTEGKILLSPLERKYLRNLPGPQIFSTDAHNREVVAPVIANGAQQALIWVYSNDSVDLAQERKVLGIGLLSAIFGIVSCTIFASLLARSIAKPLSVLTRATRQLVRNPEDTSSFPLPVTSTNEVAGLTMAFNLMVASIQEQRAGLNDTLALLDSMLANAPIGFAFFDRKLRFVRVNHFMARMNGLAVSRHLGRTVAEIFPEVASRSLENAIERVFETGQAVRDLELIEGSLDEILRARSWLANVYPVRTDTQTVRWVGVILVDTTERHRSEDALRKSEKLAAAGRLAASIAHEINNPLEAITNLLFLLRQGKLDEESAHYLDMAQHEVARVSEITQQTLRFYRQSTVAVMTTLSELLDSVLTLHQGRVSSLQVEVIRCYEEETPLYCFAGELRQLFANLIGNALDAMSPDGGRLLLRVRAAHSARNPEVKGVRVTVADTGTGMRPDVKRRIFEPFFTTKDATGTGLGLWVSAEIIAKHRGTVFVRSLERSADRPGGTVFTVFFPIPEEKPDGLRGGNPAQ